MISVNDDKEYAEAFHEEFWSRVGRDETDCWIWTGHQNYAGHGVLDFRGSKFMAHRHMHELFLGPVTPRMPVWRTCLRPRCVKPEHLSLQEPD